MAYTDNLCDCLIFKEGIQEASSYRFTPPPTFKKLNVHLIGSIIGVDHHLEIVGNTSKNDMPRKKHTGVATSASTNTNRRNQSGGPKKSENLHSREDRSALAQVQRCIQNVARSATTNSARQNKQTVTITPQKDDDNGRRLAVNTSDLPTESPPTNPQRSGSESIVPEQAQTHPMASSVRMEAARVERGQSNPGQPANSQDAIHVKNRPIDGARMVTPLDRGGIQPTGQHTSVNCAQRAKRAFSQEWQHSRRKQQKNQQRAFVSRNDNPFSLFQHDPNDAESFLDGISRREGNPSDSRTRHGSSNRAAREYFLSANRMTATSQNFRTAAAHGISPPRMVVPISRNTRVPRRMVGIPNGRVPCSYQNNEMIIHENMQQTNRRESHHQAYQPGAPTGYGISRPFPTAAFAPNQSRPEPRNMYIEQPTSGHYPSASFLDYGIPSPSFHEHHLQGYQWTPSMPYRGETYANGQSIPSFTHIDDPEKIHPQYFGGDLDSYHYDSNWEFLG